MSGRPWAASDSNDDEEGIVRLFDARDNLVAELTPAQALELSAELADVSSYVADAEPEWEHIDGTPCPLGPSFPDSTRSPAYCNHNERLRHRATFKTPGSQQEGPVDVRTAFDLLHPEDEGWRRSDLLPDGD